MNKHTPEIEYDYWDIDECATYHGIKISNADARALYDNIITSKTFLKSPNIETYLSLLNKHFKDRAEAEKMAKDFSKE